LRGLWENIGDPFTYQGKVYNVKDAKFGPAPAHRIPIWAGAIGPKMLRLTGRMADGLFVTMGFFPPERLPKVQMLVDEGAREARRSPDAIRRGNNIHGIIRPGAGSTSFPAQPGVIDGTAGYWADQIATLYQEHRQDTFSFWSSGEDIGKQVEIFAKEVVPAVKERVAAEAF